jgi:hypothetical protein
VAHRQLRLASFIFSDLRVLGTIGTTIALPAVG